jgi:disulfide oxidoreductase YuzD
LARRVRAEYPSVEVRVIDIGVSSEQLADGVFAVPTMVLDGEVISLGTPSWKRIARVLDSKLAAV